MAFHVIQIKLGKKLIIVGGRQESLEGQLGIECNMCEEIGAGENEKHTIEEQIHAPDLWQIQTWRNSVDPLYKWVLASNSYTIQDHPRVGIRITLTSKTIEGAGCPSGSCNIDERKNRRIRR